MTIVTPEEIRWCVEAFPRDRQGGYPITPGTVTGSRTSEAAAAFMDSSGRRWSNCHLAYAYLWHRPNHEACRWEINDFLERHGHQHGYHPRARDLVLRCWAYETGEVRRNPHSKQLQEVLRAISDPVQPSWDSPHEWRIIAEGFAQFNKDRKKAILEIIGIMNGLA